MPGDRLGVALVVAALVACGRPAAVPSAHGTSGSPTGPASRAAAVSRNPGSPIVGPRPIELAVYLPAEVSQLLLAEARDEVRARFPGMTIQVATPSRSDPPVALILAPSLEELPPPTSQQLALFGRGIDATRAAAVAKLAGVLVLDWQLDDDPLLERLRAGEQIAGELARRHDGFVWDEQTRELYAVDAWRKTRFDSWDGGMPDMRRNIVIHYYETDGGRHRAVTLGMAKFGLPDLVVQDVPVSQSEAMSFVMDATAQQLVEGGAVGPHGEVTLDPGAFRHSGVRATYQQTFLPAPPPARLSVVAAKREEGDADNRLFEVRFPAYAGTTDVERQASALQAIVGSQPERMAGAAANDPELAAVKRKVQARLPAVAAAFRKGLAPGEHVTVKLPFDTDDGGIEWMWVGVTEWTGDVVRGYLENEPEYVSKLRLGSKVEAKVSKIADYFWSKADGSHEGGESSEILERREAAKGK